MTGASVTFLGGVREIGGNKILIEDGPDRILFDFGPSFSPLYEAFYVNFLAPRTSSPVKDLLEFDLLPRLEGLYAKAALADSDLAYRPPEIHGLFVSHAHYDHAGYLSLIDSDIPVYVGAGTKTLLDTIEESSPRKYGDHRWKVVADRHPVKIGKMEVLPYPVDHSIPGAYGYLIRTSSGTVVYTGDFRRHGPRAPDTDSFLLAAKKENPVALVIEGTRVGPESRQNLTEVEVGNGVDGLLQQTNTLALVCSYPRDLDRLATLYAAARRAERELVVSYKTAHLLTKVAAQIPGSGLPPPGPGSGIQVYGRRKKVYKLWERPYVEMGISADHVRENGEKFLLALDLMHFAELIDLRPPRGSPFVHSMSEPFSEDDVDDRVFHNWLDHFGLNFVQMHASGHCSATELSEIARSIAPDRLFPVHTQHPEAFEASGVNIVSPEKGERYGLEV